MIFFLIKSKKIKKKTDRFGRIKPGGWRKKDIDPEDVFMDSVNLPGYSLEKHEGSIEYALGRIPFVFFKIAIILGAFFYFFQLARLQIYEADFFRERANINQFRKIETDPERGIIYDINGKKLVSNIPSFAAYLNKEKTGGIEGVRRFMGVLSDKLGRNIEDLFDYAGVSSTTLFSDLPPKILVFSGLPRGAIVELESN